MVKNLPANTGDMGSIPGLGWSHMLCDNEAQAPQLLSLNTQSPCSANKRGHHNEKPLHLNEEKPLFTTREKPTQQQRPNTAKNK